MAKSKEKKNESGQKKASEAAAYVPRKKAFYQEEVVPKLREEFEITNVMAVPRLEKIVLNIGLGQATVNIKLLDEAVEELGQIAGQRATITRARNSIAAFKIREGMPIGCRVTLRGLRMWDFLDRLIAAALPRVRDFRGISRSSFDGRGNYTLGVKDHLIFPDLDYNKVSTMKGLNVTFVTSSPNDEQALFMLQELGMPFRRLASS
jgi:large subunit ribosomal protein L5